ncbi:MAG: glycine cleavage system protein GcvH [Candidatus Zixiibacteriota bacterium]
MNVPADLKYTSEHEWVGVEGRIATVGITDYAQGELGDVVFVELPKIGAVVKRGEAFGTIEAVKAVSELFSPVTGKIVEVNAALGDDPMTVNRDCYGDGWMIRVDIDDHTELEQLLDSDGYSNLIGH